MKWYLVKEGSGTSWRESALFLVFVQLYRKESTSVEKKERVTGLSRGEGLQCPRTCQGPESMLLYRSGLPMASSVFGL